jgi:hypothetical protein
VSDIYLPDFQFDNIFIDQIENIELRLSMLPSWGTHQSIYLVYAYPRNAKQRKTSGVLTVWPEFCLGMISPIGPDWRAFPTRRDGTGWYKRAIGTYDSRVTAANGLLTWLVDQNGKRHPERDSERADLEDINPTGFTSDLHLAIALYDAYMYTFDTLFLLPREIAKRLEINWQSSHMLGKILRNAGLIEIAENGLWGCLVTKEDISRLEAIDLFVEKLPKYANRITKYIAVDHKATRSDMIARGERK